MFPGRPLFPAGSVQGETEDIRRFAGDEEQFDDITMPGMTYTAPV
jgi:hypothetical protein